MQPIFVMTDQLADVFPARAIASPGDLQLGELLQVIQHEIFIAVTFISKLPRSHRRPEV